MQYIPTCPYCNNTLPKIPKRKAKCPYCKNDIHVRSEQDLFDSQLLTEKDARTVDWFNKLLIYGFRRDDFFRKKDELTQKFKTAPPSTDIIWGLFQEALLKNANDYHRLSVINYDMAIFLSEERKNPFYCLQESKKMELINYKQKGVQKIKILSINDSISCNSCKNLDGKTFLINDALNNMPIPPNDCPFCRCRYIAANFI